MINIKSKKDKHGWYFNLKYAQITGECHIEAKNDKHKENKESKKLLDRILFLGSNKEDIRILKDLLNSKKIRKLLEDEK